MSLIMPVLSVAPFPNIFPSIDNFKRLSVSFLTTLFRLGNCVRYTVVFSYFFKNIFIARFIHQWCAFNFPSSPYLTLYLTDDKTFYVNQTLFACYRISTCRWRNGREYAERSRDDGERLGEILRGHWTAQTSAFERHQSWVQSHSARGLCRPTCSRMLKFHLSCLFALLYNFAFVVVLVFG